MIRPVALLTLLLLAGRGLAAPAEEIDIPYRVHVLENGLRLVVHEDHKAPVVAVNIWYHVGSKNEVPGRTGFAHLFEHLMFQGSENLAQDYLNFMAELGATDLNGTTFFDRTNYFQTVPTNALDTVLWAESDRMGHFDKAITQAVLDEQRGVVQNEKRQRDNQPYGKVFQTVLRQVFPADHPYSWETIGSMADLDAATLEDVREWFGTYYGPNNAVLVIAGDVDTDDVIARVEKYFGDIPPGPPLTRFESWIPTHASARRQRMEDRVSQPRLYLTWPGPRWGTRAAHHLELAAAILSGDKNSRLYERLVYRDQIASDVELGANAFEISGLTYLQISAQPGVTLAQLEAVVNEELERFRRDGPTRRELERVKAQRRAAFLGGIEKVGGFGGKAGTLAESMVYGGSPDAWRRALTDGESASREDLRNVARAWLTDTPFVLEVTPVPELSATAAALDRATPPPVGEPPTVRFPDFERATLDNGLELIVVERDGIPMIELELLMDAGYAADTLGKPGTASMAMSMLDEGTRSRSALEISEQLALLGASLQAGSSLDTSSVSLQALVGKLDESLEIFADVVLNPAFPAAELERLRKAYLAALSQEKTSPTGLALRVVPRLLYGEGHAYAQPLTGTGTESGLRALEREDLETFHRTWFKPNHATLIVVGPVGVSELKPRLQKLFGSWAPGTIPPKRIEQAVTAPTDVLYLVDRPGADQSVIFAGQLIPPVAAPDNLAIEALNDVLGGKFTARINMNLREAKHWSYGARSFITDARGPRPLLAYAPVQKDRTAESIAEIRREFTEIVAGRPASDAEVALVKRSNTLSLPGRWETGAAVLASLSELAEFDLPDDYWRTYAGELRGLTTDEINAAGRRHLTPGKLVFVVVGDRQAIEEGLRGLDFEKIQLIDADGELL